MIDILTVLIIVILLFIYLVMLRYWIRTMSIMGGQSTKLGVLSFFFAPIPQVIYYFNHKRQLDAKDRTAFNRYLLSISVVIALALLFFIMVTLYPHLL